MMHMCISEALKTLQGVLLRPCGTRYKVHSTSYLRLWRRSTTWGCRIVGPHLDLISLQKVLLLETFQNGAVNLPGLSCFLTAAQNWTRQS